MPIFQNDAMTTPSSPINSRLGNAAILIMLLILWGLAGAGDYEAARTSECGAYNKAYDAKRDVCIPKEHQQP
jgi:hypothetical protein